MPPDPDAKPEKAEAPAVSVGASVERGRTGFSPIGRRWRNLSPSISLLSLSSYRSFDSFERLL
jgi:hypothetical protein